ncbi:MAG: amino acid permease, partial [Nitrosospira sp.]|nr:amino acid permease [Nitrosospira sp.]
MSINGNQDGSVSGVGVTAPATADKLRRSMSVWNSLTLGFAVVSPVVGLYAIMGVQTAVTGGGWFAALVICLVMQL